MSYSSAGLMLYSAAGAGQGIGRAWAHALAEAGAAVAGKGHWHAACSCSALVTKQGVADMHVTWWSTCTLALWSGGCTYLCTHSTEPLIHAMLLRLMVSCPSVVDVDLSKAQQVVQELQLKGARSLAIQADVSSKKDCQRCVVADQGLLLVGDSIACRLLTVLLAKQAHCVLCALPAGVPHHSLMTAVCAVLCPPCRMVSDAASGLGRLDIAINNAGEGATA